VRAVTRQSQRFRGWFVIAVTLASFAAGYGTAERRHSAYQLEGFIWPDFVNAPLPRPTALDELRGLAKETVDWWVAQARPGDARRCCD